MKDIIVDRPTYAKPNMNLTVRRVEASAWHSLGFDKHHYLTSELNKSCKCFVFFWDEEPCAFIGLLNSPRKGHPEMMSISRIVVMPDFQGIGIGKIAIEFICGIASNKWQPTSYNGKIRRDSKKFEEGKYNNRLKRASYCFKYCGESIKGYEELMLPINELRKKSRLISTFLYYTKSSNNATIISNC